MTTYFSSDFHLSHANVIKFDNRPFKDVEEMNEAIINNHNAIVGKDDPFYFLGDFCFKSQDTKKYMERLNGKLHFIAGNHDKSDTIKLYQKYGTYLGGYAEIKVDGHLICLSHYAHRVWNKSHHGSLHLYAHSHGSLEAKPWGRSQDVGIMLNDYKPFSSDYLIENLMKREIHKEDHHGTREEDKLIEATK